MAWFLGSGQGIPGVTQTDVQLPNRSPWLQNRTPMPAQTPSLADVLTYLPTPSVGEDHRDLRARIVDSALADMTSGGREHGPAGLPMRGPSVAGGMRLGRPSARMGGLPLPEKPPVPGIDDAGIPALEATEDFADPSDIAKRGLADARQAPSASMVDAVQGTPGRDLINKIIGELSGGGQDKDEARWMAAAKAAAGMMASRSPYGIGGIGEGALVGLSDYQQYLQNAAKNRSLAAQLQLGVESQDESVRQHKSTEDYRNKEIDFRHEDRQDRLAASREELEYKYAALKSASEDRNLSIQERAQAAREARQIQLQIAQIAAGSRERVADTNAASREKVAAMRAEARAKDPSRTREADILVDKGVAPDWATAYSMVRSGTNELASYQRIIQAEKKELRKNYQDAMGNLTIPDETLEQLAVANVEKRNAAKANKGVGQPSDVDRPKAPDDPARKTEAKPAEKNAQQQPVVPPRPQGVPGGAQYSPSQKKWWWQENGQWKSSD